MDLAIAYSNKAHDYIWVYLSIYTRQLYRNHRGSIYIKTYSKGHAWENEFNCMVTMASYYLFLLFMIIIKSSTTTHLF